MAKPGNRRSHYTLPASGTTLCCFLADADADAPASQQRQRLLGASLSVASLFATAPLSPCPSGIRASRSNRLFGVGLNVTSEHSCCMAVGTSAEPRRTLAGMQLQRPVRVTPALQPRTAPGGRARHIGDACRGACAASCHGACTASCHGACTTHCCPSVYIRNRQLPCRCAASTCVHLSRRWRSDGGATAERWRHSLQTASGYSSRWWTRSCRACTRSSRRRVFTSRSAASRDAHPAGCEVDRCRARGTA